MRLAGNDRAGDVVWIVTAVAVLIPLVLSVVRDLWRREPGVDIIAVLAMAGSLALGEYLAGAIIALMLTTGWALESYAAGRADEELSALLLRAPRVAHRYRDGELETIPIAEVMPGDRLVVKSNEVVPVDGVASGAAVLDESALTGEALPVTRERGDRVGSGTVNAGDSFEIRAVATAGESTYAGIVRLVEQARTAKAPFVRLADRYALFFVPITLVVAAAAWAVSGDAVRALAVLVVATPCPLLLAVPIAIVAGISRAARRGIIVKGGGALETLARGEILFLDKTGTVTLGTPELSKVVTFGDWSDADEVLGLAASLDQMSSHVLAAALVEGARRRRLELAFPEEVGETAGAGIEGVIGGRRVAVGSLAWISRGAQVDEEVRAFRRRSARSGGSTVFVSVDGRPVGAVVFEDRIRPDSPRTIRRLKHSGIRSVIMATGDHPVVAETVGSALGVDKVLAERSPEEKLEAVQEARREGITVMVGDGINDAPALAAADVGVAMGARGATSSSEAADVVLIVDRLDRLVEGIAIARRSRTVALQSVWVGMGLSFAAMGVAAVGLLPPVGGALLQELIDAVAIFNALRALTGEGLGRARPQLSAEMSRRLRAEHEVLIPAIDQIRMVGDRLDEVPPERAGRELHDVLQFVEEVLVPHEENDDREIYPVIAGLIGGDEPLAAMSHTHQEIFHAGRLLRRLVEDIPDSGPEPDDVRDLRRHLYGLHAILRLHFAQEEELYLSLNDQYLKPLPIETGETPVRGEPVGRRSEAH